MIVPCGIGTVINFSKIIFYLQSMDTRIKEVCRIAKNTFGKYAHFELEYKFPLSPLSTSLSSFKD